ncbi:cystathionine beta-lyase [Methylobacterium variabile]|jgi:cytochrome c|uniref:Cystathionine beta-lyase n=1 Tax=Methylobacterium variabile TaxID=298794 RepID=A0A0J6VQV3_9HYPH|nr:MULTISPECIES: cytochrome c [Methylobacterium]KMO41586.1 cystathionine beta-lyase [Methylobacterium variabile]NGM37347.1 cytochrome c [Methylobacterium sp. DB0501]UHC20297.1 cytochrome c [Methylobacterium currus]
MGTAPAIATASALLMCLAAVPAAAWDERVKRGRALARTECARCHAVGRTGVSPLRQAPPFRTLHERYPVEDLAEALTEGIRTGHPTMPEFRFEPDQAEALIAYLKTLER